MSKDVIIAGTIAVGCIALIAVAFIAPKSKPTPEPETPKTEPYTPIDNGVGGTGATVGGSLNNPFDPMNPTPGINSLPPITGNGTSALNTTPGGLNGGFPPLSPTSGTAGTSPTPNFDTHLHDPVIVVPPVVEAPLAVENKTHTVGNGELLGDIALKYYKSSKQWRKIAEANPGIDPKNLKVGQKLVIPGLAAKTSDAPVVAGAGERTYTIKSGDTLYLVAKKELGSASRWKEIEKLNGVSSSELRVGQVIKLPASTSSLSTMPDVSAPTAPAAEGKTHTVTKGETLGDISKRYYGTSKSWKKIVDANPGTSPENLKVGQKLVIPEIAGSPAKSTPGTAVDSATSAAGDYVIKVGDTLSIIAQKELGSKNRWKEIQDANPGLDPRTLRTGQRIKIPGKKSEAAPAAPEKVAPSSTSPFATPTPAAPGANLPPKTSPGLNSAAPFGIPAGSPNATQPTNFPSDPSFASPYNGSNFGEPSQPFAQTGQGFSQTGTTIEPTPFPGQSTIPNAIPGAPGDAIR
jgi:nucleoid-associated protein YgaU